jgi:hypothetical protein
MGVVPLVVEIDVAMEATTSGVLLNIIKVS